LALHVETGRFLNRYVVDSGTVSIENCIIRICLDDAPINYKALHVEPVEYMKGFIAFNKSKWNWISIDAER
jgi:hypothetical protein